MTMTTGRKNRRNRKARAAQDESRGKLVSIADAKRKASHVPRVLDETIDKSLFDGVNDRERDLLAILSTCRKSNGHAEQYIIAEYLDSIPGMQCDSYGNRYMRVGDPSCPMAFSSHTDSVHYMDGVQRIEFDGRTIKLSKDSKANCLGADCGIGIWIMRHMILAGVPGLYLFHRDEESGMEGSTHIVKNNPEIVDGVKALIAFDRRGFDSIITHQMGERTASDVFGETLAFELNMQIHGAGYELDTGGSYTDSYAYRRLIPECTNIGVGYLGQHGKSETQCMRHALQLLDAMIRIDYVSLIIERDPSETEFDAWDFRSRAAYYNGTSSADYGTPVYDSATRRFSEAPPYSDGFIDDLGTRAARIPSLESLIRDNVSEVADILRDYGMDEIELHDAIRQRREMFFGSH